MRRLSFAVLFFLGCFIAAQGTFAQSADREKADSLLKELSSAAYAKNDTNKVKLLSAISDKFSKLDPDQGIKYAQQALDLATTLSWKHGLAGAHKSMGVNCTRKSDYPAALDHFFKAMKIYEAISGILGVANTANNIGYVYYQSGDNANALEYYSKALKLYTEAGDKTDMADVTQNIASVYDDKGDSEHAFEYYFKALKIYEETADKQNMALASGNIGEAYVRLKKYKLGISYIHRALKIDEETGNKFYLANSLNQVGYAYLMLATDTSVIPGSTPVEEGHSSTVPVVAIPADKTTLLKHAVAYLERGLDTAKKINNIGLIQNGYEVLAIAYRLTGNYKLALESYRNYTAIKDSVYSREKNDQIVRLGMQNEYDKKTAEVQKKAALRLQRQQGYTWIGISGALLLMGFVFVMYRNNKLLSAEKKRSDDLLLNILPAEVATELKNNGSAAAKHYEDVTVLLTDFVNFTKASERMTPGELIEELHTCFKAFDEISSRHNIEKIKTIGDAYLAVAGLPAADENHAVNAVLVAIEICEFIANRHALLGEKTFQVRIGVHSGSVVAGIVGVKKFAYDIWGDTVNTAARMEESSIAGKINISQSTYELVKDKFNCIYRGELEAKNKGKMKMYFVSK